MWLRFPQHDGERTPKKETFSVRRGWSSKSTLPKLPSTPRPHDRTLPSTPTTPRAPTSQHLYPPESPISSASSSSDQHPLTPLASPSVSPLLRHVPSFSSPRPSTRTTFYEPSIGKIQPTLSGKLPDDPESSTKAMKSFSKRVATLVRSRSWSMNKVEGAMQEPNRPPASPSRRIFSRGSSSVRDLRLEPAEPQLLTPTRNRRPEPLLHVPRQYAQPLIEGEVTDFAPSPMTERAVPSSIKSEAIRSRIPPSVHLHPTSAHYTKRSASKYDDRWTDAMRLQVEYYTRPPSPPHSPRRGPAPPPRPARRRLGGGAESVKSLPLESYRTRFPPSPAAPSIKTISSATSRAENATAILADIIAGNVPLKPLPDMPTSARSSVSVEPSEAEKIASEARFKVKRKALPMRNRRLEDLNKVKVKAKRRRGTFGEDELADLAGQQEQLLSKLVESSDSCEPRSSRETTRSAFTSASESEGRPRPWGYV